MRFRLNSVYFKFTVIHPSDMDDFSHAHPIAVVGFVKDTLAREGGISILLPQASLSTKQR